MPGKRVSRGARPDKNPPRSTGHYQHHARIVLDEDLPPALADHLRARGISAVAIDDLRGELAPSGASISDDQVCAEVARMPSVLVTLNIRDYADLAFMERLVEEFQVTVVIVRPPKAEEAAGLRPAAVHDIVHRHAQRIVALVDGPPVVVSANRIGFRKRALSELVKSR